MQPGQLALGNVVTWSVPSQCSATKRASVGLCDSYTPFLSAAAHRVRCLRLVASTSKLTYRFFFFGFSIHPRSANQLVLVHSDTSGSICQRSRGQEAFLQRASSAALRGRSKIQHCSRCCRLRFGDKESLIMNFYLRSLTPQTGRCWRRPRDSAMYFFLSNTIKRSLSQGSGLEVVTRCQPSNTHALTINDVLLTAMSETRLLE